MSMSRDSAIQAKLARMPANFRRNYREAMTGKSRAAAMDAYCWECLGWECPPADCTSPACPLYSFRPAGMPHSSPELTPEQREAVGKRLVQSRKHYNETQTGTTPGSANA